MSSLSRIRTTLEKRGCLDPTLAAGYAGGWLVAEAVVDVEAHLARCSDCRWQLSDVVRAASGPRAAGNEEGARGALPPGEGGEYRGPPVVTRRLSPGARVGRYVVDSFLGAGGMGAVYAAHDPRLDRRVALKMVREDFTVDESAQGRLLREGQAMARLAHPNVVVVHDVVLRDRQVFIAMELIEGVSVQRWLESEIPPWRSVLQVYVEAGRGLAAAHAIGLVHRDFKPENVLRDTGGRIAVTDFGLARWASPNDPQTRPDEPPRRQCGPLRATQSGGGLGTPAFMAPERHRGDPADERSDQFSYAVALYEGLYGEYPFEADEPRALYDAIVEGRVRAPPPGRKIPQRIRSALLRGLRAKPSERYPSMECLLSALTCDPMARWRRVGVSGGALVLLGATAWASSHRAAAPVSLVCAGAERELVGVWDEGRKRKVAGAFRATHQPYAEDALRGTERALDSYAHDWTTSHVKACEATRLRGEQSEEALDLRMECLDDRRRGLGALAEVFEHADAEVVVNARSAVEGLTPLASCNDLEWLRARVKPPTEPAAAARVVALREDTAQVRAMLLAGKYRQGLTLAQALSKTADELGYLPARAEARRLEGALYGFSGDLKAAEESLYLAASAADAAGDDRLRVTVFGDLVYFVGDAEGKLELMPIFLQQEQGATARLGGDEESEAKLNDDEGWAYSVERKADEALAALTRAKALWEKLRGPESIEVARDLGYIGNVLEIRGDLDEALDDNRRALAIEQKILGPDHPTASMFHLNLGNIYFEKTEWEEAAASYRRGIAVLEAALGPQSAYLARGLSYLGSSLLRGGDASGARKLQERALAIEQATLSPTDENTLYTLIGLGEAMLEMNEAPRALETLERAAKFPGVTSSSPSIARADLSSLKFDLARALTALGREPKRARALVADARGLLAGRTVLPVEREMLAQIDAWLVAHPPVAGG